jgi:MerR family transcriptional regulator, mercuric resistance operon regulatory protein
MTGCPIETVRYYQRAGIIAEPPRTESGRRLYGEDHIRRLQFTRRARELGFSLERAKRLLRLSERPEMDGAAAQAIAAAHLAEVRQRIAELQHIQATLSRMLGLCAEGISPHSAIIVPLIGDTPESGV